MSFFNNNNKPNVIRKNVQNGSNIFRTSISGPINQQINQNRINSSANFPEQKKKNDFSYHQTDSSHLKSTTPST
jgi:hypothetical protein